MSEALEELFELIRGCDCGGDQYNQIVGDSMVAVRNERAALEIRIAGLLGDIATLEEIIDEIPSTVYENIAERLEIDLED
jgi:hypothetical protein